MSISGYSEAALNSIQLAILTWMTLSLSRKSRFHQNFRFTVVLLSGSVFYLLLFCAILDVFDKLETTFRTTTFALKQLGWVWYRSAILTFVSERFACALMTQNYESKDHIWGKIISLIFTGCMAFLLVVILVLTQDQKTVYTVIWTALIESVTLPVKILILLFNKVVIGEIMTIYILLRTKAEWNLRHRGASLSQRFQLSEFRSSVKFFVPLVISNFACVFVFLSLQSVITFGNLDSNGLGFFEHAIEVLDFYQRLFYVCCVIRIEEDSLNDFLEYIKRKLKWKHRPNRIREVSMAKLSQDEYFKGIQLMWA